MERSSGGFVYDADGNLVQGKLGGGVPFLAEYDAENRLTSMSFSKNGVSIEERFYYQYDLMLAKYERFENGTLNETKHFVRFGLLELQERDAANNVIAENVWRIDSVGGVDGLVARQKQADHYSYLTNHLGHVYGVLDNTGTRLATHAYSPYGGTSGDAFDIQPFGMSTKRSDFDSGLVYFGYRFYLPSSGRWLNRDPLQERGGLNLYAYVGNNPIGFVDPDGRLPIFCLGCYQCRNGGVNGALGTFVQGGNFDDYVGAVRDGVIAGAFGSFGGVLGAVTANMAANAWGQALAIENQGSDWSCFSVGSALGAGIGSGYGALFARFPSAWFVRGQLDFGMTTMGSILGKEVDDAISE